MLEKYLNKLYLEEPDKGVEDALDSKEIEGENKNFLFLANPKYIPFFKQLADNQQKVINDILLKYSDIVDNYFQSITSEVALCNILDNINSHPLLKDLYVLNFSGIGKGEILCYFLCQGSQITGTNVSYDLIWAGQNYEIKAPLEGDIRLGTEGSLGRFKFWDHTLHTLYKILENKDAINNWIQERSQNSLDKQNLLSLQKATQTIFDRKDFLLRGEFNITVDQAAFTDFFNSAFNLSISPELSTSTTYNQVIFKGPYSKEIKMNINPLDQSKIQSKIPFEINPQEGFNFETELRTLYYVRQGARQYFEDINAEINQVLKVSNTDFIVIRHTGESNVIKSFIVHIAKDQFKFIAASQGRVRVREQI